MKRLKNVLKINLCYAILCFALVIPTMCSLYAVDEDNFNWVQWYEWNGVASVTSMIKDGSMSAIDACEKIIIPAYNAGKTEQAEIEYFIKKCPEMKPHLITPHHL